MTNIPPGTRVGMSVGEALASIRLDGETVPFESVEEPVMKKIRKSKSEKLVLVKPGMSNVNNRIILMVGVETKNETNQRVWRAKHRRAGAAWNAVRRAVTRLDWLQPLADHYADGGCLRVVLTRLGGRKLDRSNIPAATKGVEDAVAFMLGCNDGDMRWRAEWDQEPGGPVGVRVEVSAYENAKVA